jgi:Protein of unknown function (DUF4038)/Putative collagen-binding domain of a collagenase
VGSSEGADQLTDRCRLERGLQRLLCLLCLLGAVATQAIAFPVKYSADHRYLVDQSGAPFPIMGRTAWFVTSLTVADYHTFIDDTAARGYSAIELHVINHDPRGNHPPFNGNGDAPFLNRLDGTSWDGALSNSAPDFTTPNEAYWSFVDAFLAYCESRGLLVFMFPAYVGWLGGDQGWMKEMVANGPAKMQSYGAWIATRYKNRSNLVWMMGGDMGTAPYTFDSTQTAVEAALLSGLKSVAGQQSTYFSAEWGTESIGTDQPNFGAAMTLNSVYSGWGNVSIHGRRAYAHVPAETAFLLEEPYDEEGPDGNNVNGNATQPVRRFQWWGWLTTIGGYISGNGYVWPFVAPAWKGHLDTQGTRDMARLNTFIRSVAWYKLVPSGLGGMKPLITAGGSTENLSDYVAAAATPDGTLMVAYVPPDHSGTITVDMSVMGGPSRARWFDPTSASYADITLGAYTLPNAGTRTFTVPGSNSAGESDWALILDTSAKATIDVNVQGLWWNAPANSESGWGINFAHQGDTIFASWFTYDLDGHDWWLSMTATKTAANTFTGELFETTGPAFSAQPFDKNLVTRHHAGTATLTFSDANNGSFQYQIDTIHQRPVNNPQPQTKTITRLVFGPLPTCTYGSQPDLALAGNYQDLWAVPADSESGWGINLNHEGDTIFAAWFTYDVDGTAMWLSGTAGKSAPRVYTSFEVDRTTGPAFNAVPFDGNKVVRMNVGTMDFTFADGNSGTFHYKITGVGPPVEQTKTITRELFAPPAGTVCQ